MKRAVNALGDRLLGVLVPRVDAAAEPCGPLDMKFCFCLAQRVHARPCCRYSGSCYPCRVISGSCP